MSRRNTMQNNNLNEQQQQETNLNEVDLAKSCNVAELNLNSDTLNNKKNFKAKTQCQHVIPGTGFPMGSMHNEFVHQPKRINASRAMSPLNHIYMEIDPKSEDGTVYEALNQSEAGSRSETYMLSSVSDMSDDDFRRCSDMSRQSSSRYAENKPLIRAGTGQFNMDRNLLTTINSVMHSQSVRVGNPQHHHRTSILSTISGLRYTDPSQPGPPPPPPPPPPRPPRPPPRAPRPGHHHQERRPVRLPQPQRPEREGAAGVRLPVRHVRDQPGPPAAAAAWLHG